MNWIKPFEIAVLAFMKRDFFKGMIEASIFIDAPTNSSYFPSTVRLVEVGLFIGFCKIIRKLKGYLEAIFLLIREVFFLCTNVDVA